MMKKSLNRSQRSKGIKLKHVLQICVLLGVCVWLLYQLKYSHDKKKEFDENDTKTTTRSQSNDAVMKFGRKELPGLREDFKISEQGKDGVKGESNHEDKELKEVYVRREEDEQEEANDNPDDDQLEEETKIMDDEGENRIEEMENDAQDGGDDEIDEQDHNKRGEVDREDEFLDEERELEGDADENENEETENEEEKSQIENVTASESEDHRRGDTNSREEHYKADDASSAVFHDVQVDTIGVENEGSKISGHESGSFGLLQKNNTLDDTNESGEKNPSSFSNMRDGEKRMPVDVISFGEEHGRNISLDSDTMSLPEGSKNTSMTILEATKNSTGSQAKTSESMQNETEIMSGGDQLHNITAADATILEEAFSMNGDQPYSSATTSLNMVKNAAGDLPRQNIEDPEHSTKKTISTIERELRGANPDIPTVDSPRDVVENDPIDDADNTVSQVEREGQTDLDTLPDMSVGNGNVDESATE